MNLNFNRADLALTDADLIVITCAGGKQAGALIKTLNSQSRSPQLRLIAHSDESRDMLHAGCPSAEIVVAELTNPADCARIVHGATAVFHVGPPMHAREADIGLNMIDAARAEPKEQFKHFVYSSVLYSQIRKLLNHDVKRGVEEYLVESGLPYTILQPTHFLDLFPIKKLSTEDKPIFPAHWNPRVPFSFIALKDLAAAAATVLNEREAHYSASYPLCSTGPVPYAELCGIAGKVLGKDVEISEASFDETVNGRLAMIMGENPLPHTRDSVERLVLYYNRYGLVGNPNVLRWLIGRQPTDPETWMRDQLAEEEGKKVKSAE